MGLKNAALDFACPGCQQPITIHLSDIGTIITCPNCHKTIELEDDGIGKTLENVSKLIDNF